MNSTPPATTVGGAAPSALSGLADGHSCAELLAVVAAFEFAREEGFVSSDMSAKNPTVTLVRCEARIALKKCRDLQLSAAALEVVAVQAVRELIDRSNRRIRHKKDRPCAA